MRIGLLTSGGDSPGMNAAIRGVVRSARFQNYEVVGIRRGYTGIFEKDFHVMASSSVANIIQLGGTILRSDRCDKFFEEKYRIQAGKILKAQKINYLVVIGGDGSFSGAIKLHQETGIKVIGIPGTIDNDIHGTESTIGFDTAVNTGVQMVDNIRDTANSHERTFLVEVMGRNSAEIANYVALSCGAEFVVEPGNLKPVKDIYKSVQRGLKRNKKSSIIIVAEGGHAGRTYQISEELKAKHRIESKVCILGHIQRGGRPTAYDRKLASLMGIEAVNAITRKETEMMIAEIKNNICAIDLNLSLKKSVKKKSEVELQLEKLST